MDKGQLAGYLNAGLSIEAIAQLAGKHPSTVSYWLNKHDLQPNGRRHAPRAGIARTELEELVAKGHTLVEMAARLDRSVSNVRYRLNRHGLETQGARGRRPIVPRSDLEAARAAGRTILEAACPEHGRAVFVLTPGGRVICRQCRADRVVRRRRKVKETLIAEAGGCCCLCGYDRFVGALQFHHVDPATKAFGVAQNGVTLGIDKLRAEASKCVLLCANCHAEVEHGGRELTLK